MEKLQSLRAHLLASVPCLATDPERLQMFVENGTIEFWRGANLSHNYRAAVRLIILDWVGSIDPILVPLLAWMAHYEPDCNPQEAITFEAELLGFNTMDLSLRVWLKERVVAIPDAITGRIEIEHRQPEFPADGPVFRGTWELWSRGEMLATWEYPA